MGVLNRPRLSVVENDEGSKNFVQMTNFVRFSERNDLLPLAKYITMLTG